MMAPLFALENLYRTTPAVRDLAAKSAGVLVFPDVTQGGLIVGGQYGKGVLFKGSQPAGYYNVAGVSTPETKCIGGPEQ
jgi:lipid-binding SYLF domain-containing protein